MLVPFCTTAPHTHQAGAKPSVRMMQVRQRPWLVQSYKANQSEALTQAEDSWVLIYMFSLPDSGKLWVDHLIPPTSMVCVALDTALPSLPQFSQQQDGYVIRQRPNDLPLRKNRTRFHLPQELMISFDSLSSPTLNISLSFRFSPPPLYQEINETKHVAAVSPGPSDPSQAEVKKGKGHSVPSCPHTLARP